MVLEIEEVIKQAPAAVVNGERGTGLGKDNCIGRSGIPASLIRSRNEFDSILAFCSITMIWTFDDAGGSIAKIPRLTNYRTAANRAVICKFIQISFKTLLF